MSPKTSAPRPRKRAAKGEAKPRKTRAKPRRAGSRKSPASSRGRASAEWGSLMPPPESGVKVRMYRTGLGDCFLLAFPRPAGGSVPRDRVFYALIDCGVYFGTPEPGNATRIGQIVRDIRDATGGRLNLLVITHEHWDHVSAFHSKQARSVFENEIALDKLWLAWTENLELPLAQDLDKTRRAVTIALVHALAKMQSLGVKTEGNMLRNMLDFFGGPADEPALRQPAEGGSFGAAGAAFAAKKSVQTEEAMEWIRNVYGKGKTEFLHPGEGLQPGRETVELDGVPDARVYVLGPPEDSDLIKRADPLGHEVYPKAMAMAVEASFFAAFDVIPGRPESLPGAEEVEEARRMSLPFDESFQIRRQEVEPRGKRKPGEQEPASAEFFREHYFGAEDWRLIDGDWLEAASEFALQLDNATNNTSLAFALEIGPPGAGKVLLFPGDAQVGNWLSWFGKVKLKVKGKPEREAGKDMVWSVGGRRVTAEDLLRRTVLYKVGHHGSHNATLREKGLELMGRPDGSGEFVALLPVDEHVAREKAGYGEMPLRSLIKELSIRTAGRVARNDEGATPKDSLSTLARIPGAPALRSSFLSANTPLYFEYIVTPPGSEG